MEQNQTATRTSGSLDALVIQPSFDSWWSKEMGNTMKKSRYLAKKAWNAAIATAAEHVTPGGDRYAIQQLKAV